MFGLRICEPRADWNFQASASGPASDIVVDSWPTKESPEIRRDRSFAASSFWCSLAIAVLVSQRSLPAVT